MRSGTERATDSRRRLLQVCVLLAVVVTALIASAGPASAATDVTCGYGVGGNQAGTLCWLDMSAFDQRQAETPAGQSMSVSLPGGYTISFTAHATADPTSGKREGAMEARRFPTWSGAYLGNHAYRDTPGRPALYQTTDGTSNVVMLKDITVTDSSGNVVRGYGFVMADAESTDRYESLTFSSDVPLSELSRSTPEYPYCGDNVAGGGAAGLSGVGTDTVTCRGGQPSGDGKVSNGALVVQATSPSEVSATMVGGGQQGLAFAIVTSKITLDKTLLGRASASDSFDLAVTSPSGSRIGSATVGPTAPTGIDLVSATTGTITVLPLQSGQPYTLSEAATPGSGTLMADYANSWSCHNGSTTSTTVLPTGSGLSKTVEPVAGDDITCTITNTPFSPSVTIVKSASVASFARAGAKVTYSYRVTNTGTVALSKVTVTDPMRGLSKITCPSTSLDPGTSMTCTARYTTTGADVRAGHLDNVGTVTGTTPSGRRVVDSSPLTIPFVGITIKKTADVTRITRPGMKIAYRYKVTNTGRTVLDPVVVGDPMKGLSTISCPATSLDAGRSMTCTATYRTTRADMTRRSVNNTATATGTPPKGGKVTATSTVRIPVAKPVTREFEVDTWHMTTQACATKVWHSLTWPTFRYGALAWTWRTTYGVHCFSGTFQMIKLQLPSGSTSAAWMRAINAKVTVRGIGRVHTTAGLKGMHAGTITIAWFVPKGGWVLGRPSSDRRPHRFFARS